MTGAIPVLPHYVSMTWTVKTLPFVFILRVQENETTKGWRKLSVIIIFCNLYHVSILLLLLYECGMGETRGMHEGDKCIAYKISVGEPEGKRPLKKSRCRREGGIAVGSGVNVV
jgi:hypothetical protein